MLDFSRCCRVSRVSAEWKLGRVEVEVNKRIVSYTVDGVADPLAASIHGDDRVELELVIACNTACLSTTLGSLGRALRDESGSIAIVTYRRRSGGEEVAIDGIEARLYSRNSEVIFEYNIEGIDGLEKCLLSGAKLVEPRIRELLRRGVKLYNGSLADYANLLAMLAGDELVKSMLSLVGVESSGCIESVIASSIRGKLYALLAAQLSVSALLGRAVIVYPLAPDALKPVDREASVSPPHYGRGASVVFSRAPDEAALLISRLTGYHADVKVYGDGYVAADVWVEGLGRVVNHSPSISFAVGVTAGLLYGSKLLIAHRAPLEGLDLRVLERELEKRNAVLLNMKNG